MWTTLTLFGHAHLRKLFLQFDDEHAEAVGDAAADDGDDQYGQADRPAPEVGAHDLRYLDVLVLRLLPRVRARLRRPDGHHAHRLRHEAHHGDWPERAVVDRYVTRRDGRSALADDYQFTSMPVSQHKSTMVLVSFDDLTQVVIRKVTLSRRNPEISLGRHLENSI